MQEHRTEYDANEGKHVRADRVTGNPTPAQIEAALADEATQRVILHKPGTTFRAYAFGVGRTYLVLADGSVQERLTRAERRARAQAKR